MQVTPLQIVDNSLTVLLRSANDHESAGQYRQAYHLFEQCSMLLKTEADNVIQRDAIYYGLWRLNPLWWANLQHGGLRLRRCKAADAAFYNRCFSDSVFASQFNRQRPWRGDLGRALQQSGQLPPLKTGLLQWVVESTIRGPIGLASLSSLDTINLRAELSIGFPGDVPSTMATKAMLMMLHFALVLMPFNKVYTYVYQDNPRALHNSIRFGFLHEGTLKDHFNIPGYGFVSVELTGLTRAQLHGNTHLRLLAKRRIGQIW